MYFSVISQEMSPVLVQKKNKINQSVYFVRKVSKGTKTRYQKIKMLVLVVAIAANKLISYF